MCTGHYQIKAKFTAREFCTRLYTHYLRPWRTHSNTDRIYVRTDCEVASMCAFDCNFNRFYYLCVCLLCTFSWMYCIFKWASYTFQALQWTGQNWCHIFLNMSTVQYRLPRRSFRLFVVVFYCSCFYLFVMFVIFVEMQAI